MAGDSFPVGIGSLAIQGLDSSIGRLRITAEAGLVLLVGSFSGRRESGGSKHVAVTRNG
jgi:hypothetical protein